jgi:hypothetical protein
MVDRGARPHWGQVNPLTGAQARAAYGANLDAFHDVFLRLNPTGFFDNAFSAQLGLRL